jgi:hypothetical protein
VFYSWRHYFVSVKRAQGHPDTPVREYVGHGTEQTRKFYRKCVQKYSKPGIIKSMGAKGGSVMSNTNILFYPDLAKLLRRDINSLRKDVAHRRIPFHKPFGPRGRVVFLRDEIEVWLRQPGDST